MDVSGLERPELTFDEIPHIYKLNGIIIPSVSEIMTPLSQAEYGDINTKTLQNAADRGTEVHNAIENWIKFGIVDISEEHKGYFDAFMGWWNERNPEVVGSEARTYHKLMRYAGTVDMLAYIDGELNLIDFKTTYRIINKNCGVQLEAYAQALASHGIKVERKRILHLCKDGKWDDPQFPAMDAERWRVFGSLKMVYDYVKAA